jgi:hypothetical protein
MRGTLLLLPLCACYAAPPQIDDVPTPDTSQANPSPQAANPPSNGDPQVVCDMAKFSFTQAAGCVNDGWVEFCADKGGAPVTTALRSIAPDVQITEGEIGHAGCDEVNDYHVTEPLHDGDCMAPHGALTDDAWGRFCALSQLQATKHFVPGFAE